MKFLKASFIIVTILFIGAMVIFKLNIQRSEDRPLTGKAGSKLLQMIASENASDQYVYFKISDSVAFQVGKDYLSGADNAVSGIVKYKTELVPYCWLCGENIVNGSVLLSPYIKDHYAYGLDVDYSTGVDSTYKVYDLNTNRLSTLSIAEGKQLGLSLSDTYKANVDEVASNYGILSFSKEACFIVISAFIIIYLVFLIWFVVLKLKRKRP